MAGFRGPGSPRAANPLSVFARALFSVRLRNRPHHLTVLVIISGKMKSSMCFRSIKGLTLCLLLFGVGLISACSQESGATDAKAHQGHAGHPSPSAQAPARRIPAHFKEPPDVRTLPPTLDPAQFKDRVREAYQVARDNPQVLAQLPCFCYCDTIGHKSLHSCYEDDHSTGCTVCIDSALTAKVLTKEGKSPSEIPREIDREVQPILIGTTTIHQGDT